MIEMMLSSNFKLLEYSVNRIIVDYFVKSNETLARKGNLYVSFFKSSPVIKEKSKLIVCVISL